MAAMCQTFVRFSPKLWREYLGILFVFIACFLTIAECYEPLKVNVDASKPVFTDADLAAFDGSEPGKPIYMGVKGVVFDISAGERFYGKGKSYNALVGKDSTRAVAKMSLDPEDLNSNIDGLSEEELKSLDDVFTQTYEAKYPVVGYMDYLFSKPDPEDNKTEL